MEADLSRFHHIDYLDRWRFDERGQRRLTLRQIWVRIRYLPPESAVAALERNGELHWSLEAHLLDDLRMVWTGTKEKPAKPHPARPQPSKRKSLDPKRRRKLADARKRAAERRRQIEAGEL